MTLLNRSSYTYKNGLLRAIFEYDPETKENYITTKVEYTFY
jgi:hypothetical protein